LRGEVTNTYVFIITGSHTGFSFNIQGTAVTMGTLPTGFVDAVGPVSQPGFGTFSNGIDCSTPIARRVAPVLTPWFGTLQFDVSRGTGTVGDDAVAATRPVFPVVPDRMSVAKKVGLPTKSDNNRNLSMLRQRSSC
jgi:hypothetical protein